MSDHGIPPHLFDPLFKATGWFLQMWGQIDNLLDIWIAIIYHKAGGNIVEKEIPRNLDRRLRFLKKSFNQLEPLQPIKDDGLEIVDRISGRIRDVRNAISHGYAGHIDEETQTITFIRMTLINNYQMHKTDSLRLSLSELLDCCIQSKSTVSDMLMLAERLLNTFVPTDELKKLLGRE